MIKKLVNVISLSKKHCEIPIEGKLAYATAENFLGRRVAGYHPEAIDICLMTQSSALALCQVQNQLHAKKLGLYIFDSYRPLRAVRDFKTWMEHPPLNEYELARKKIHYPHLEKNQLDALGYVAGDVSNHCFGDTVDLSLIDLTTGALLDMGACFDYFDEISHVTTTEKTIGARAFSNRQIFSAAMQEAGFVPYEKEYWHFTFREREIDSPLDIEITPDIVEG